MQQKLTFFQITGDWCDTYIIKHTAVKNNLNISRIQVNGGSQGNHISKVIKDEFGNLGILLKA